jgi:hypothetical protein
MTKQNQNAGAFARLVPGGNMHAKPASVQKKAAPAPAKSEVTAAPFDLKKMQPMLDALAKANAEIAVQAKAEQEVADAKALADSISAAGRKGVRL